MSIAIIKTGGKQYKVRVGDIIKVEKIAGGKLEFDDIYGGKKVVAKLVSEGKAAKVRILKFKAKKRYKRIRGHRQQYSQIKIESIK